MREPIDPVKQDSGEAPLDPRPEDDIRATPRGPLL